MREARMATLIAFVLLAAWQTPSDAQAPGAAPVVGLTVPDEVGGFRLAETHRYPDPRLGTLYRYRNNSALRPDVYVYPPGGPAGSDARNPAREEGMNFGRILTAQRDRRQIRSFQIKESAARDYVAGSDTVAGWHVFAVQETDRSTNATHLYVFGFGDQMLKVRSTWPEGSVDPADLEEFVMDLLQAVSAAKAADPR